MESFTESKHFDNTQLNLWNKIITDDTTNEQITLSETPFNSENIDNNIKNSFDFTNQPQNMKFQLYINNLLRSTLANNESPTQEELAKEYQKLKNQISTKFALIKAPTQINSENENLYVLRIYALDEKIEKTENENISSYILKVRNHIIGEGSITFKIK